MFIYPHMPTAQGASSQHMKHPNQNQHQHTRTQGGQHRERSDYNTYNYRPEEARQRTPRATSPPRTPSCDHRYHDMAVDSSSVSSISAAAATARNLYRRAKVSGPDFAEISSVVRPLHSVLKHLRAEAEDPDSLLNASGQESSVYARQLTPIIEDTDFTLKQLDTILEKYGSYPGDHDDLENGRRDGGNSSGKRMEDRERDMIALIRTKLANQKTNIDIFLDTVQLHNPTRQHRPVDLERTDGKQMNAIKDKVDIVAARLFQRRARARASGDAAEESEEEMWQQFWAELVKEGFSSDVLRKHKVSPSLAVRLSCMSWIDFSLLSSLIRVGVAQMSPNSELTSAVPPTTNKPKGSTESLHP